MPTRPVRVDASSPDALGPPPRMSALETAQIGTTPATPRPSAEEVTGWLLEGRWFTIDPHGQISAWSPVACDRFGYQRAEMLGKSFVDHMLVPDARAAGAAAVASVIDAATGEAGFTGDVDALDVHGTPLPAAFALVPIQLSVGYEFNSLLQDIANRTGASLAELKKEHE